jgi:hypothetical protein
MQISPMLILELVGCVLHQLEIASTLQLLSSWFEHRPFGGVRSTSA